MDRNDNIDPNLDNTFKYVQWKTDVDRKLASLQERVALLEGEASKKSVTNFSNEQEIVQLKSSRQNSSGDAISFTERLKTERTARYQCLWLLVCLICFLYFGVTQLIEADMNEKSLWKPESKRYVLDYSSSEEQFKMPYLWIHFFLYPKNQTVAGKLDDEKIMENIIENVVSSSFVEEANINFLYTNFSWAIRKQEIKEVIGNFSGWTLGGIGISVRLILSDPGTLMESWQTNLRVNIPTLTFNDTYMVRYFKVNVGRTIDYDLSQFEFILYDDDWSKYHNNQSNQVFFLAYREKVTETYGNKKEVGTIETELTQKIWTNYEDTYGRTGMEVKKGDVVIIFKPDLAVEHWKEYVAFGYLDWVTGMGGLFSLMTTIFFWFAFYLTKFPGSDGSVGILPEMSFVFANFESIQGIRCDKLNNGSDETNQTKGDNQEFIFSSR